MSPVEVRRGDSPVILAFPHVGTALDAPTRAALNEEGLRLRDTDWHVDRLFDGLAPDATTVRATFHRYVIDANRDPEGTSLYPGQNTTALCPTTDFDGTPIYQEGCAPDAAEIARRRDAYHAPYHARLAAEIERVKARHGVALLFDCHSIRSRIPFLFDGVLPDFNIGTNDGESCAAVIEATVVMVCLQAVGFTTVLNGRFKGGWTTRHYGRPDRRIHAVQLEIAQATHLQTESPPFAYDPAKAGRLRPHLGTFLESLTTLAESGALSRTAKDARP